MNILVRLGLCLTLGLSPAAAAGLRSFTGQLVADRPAAVSVENSGVRVTGYRFSRPLRGNGKVFKRDGEPTITLTLKNESGDPRSFTLGVVLFDDDGNLVGAATEDPGKLEPGEETEATLTFRHLNRYASSATRLQMSIEIRLD